VGAQKQQNLKEQVKQRISYFLGDESIFISGKGLSAFFDICL